MDKSPTAPSIQSPFDIIKHSKDKKELKIILDHYIANRMDTREGRLGTILEEAQDEDYHPAELPDILNPRIQEYLELDGVNSGYNLMKSVASSDGYLAIAIRRDLISEYGVTTTTEKMVVDLAVSAYVSYLECSKIYSSLLETKPKYTFNKESEEDEETGWSYEYDKSKINLLKEMSKQVTTAHQQYISAITFLKEFKRSPINIKIQTKQAFVAQNQQFNKNA